MIRRIVSVLVVVLVAVVFAVPVFAQQSVIEYFDGEVTILRGDEEFFAEFGDLLDPGDRVSTGPSSVAVIQLNDRAQIKLRENTQIWIDAVVERATSVSLDTGGVFARVARVTGLSTGRNESFRITTPSVVAGVRGTEFFVAYGRTIEDQPDLWLCVNEGSVEVAVPTTGQSTIVEEGEGVNILAGLRTTEPKFYPWTTELNWNFDPSDGEVFDDTDLDAAYADLLDQDYD